MKNKIIISLLVFLFIFQLQAIVANAQSCVGTIPNCYVLEWTHTCSGSGADCSSNLCPGGQTCNAHTEWVRNGSISCVGSAIGGSCSYQSIFCAGSDGSPQNRTCSIGGASCQGDGLCKPAGVNCCTGQSYSDPSCGGTGLRCGTQTGVPGGGGSCNSNWCTSAASCSSIPGSSQSPGTGYCAAPGDVRCCVPGGGYVPGCGWDQLQGNCTGEGQNRQYVGGVPTRPGCCNGLSENWQGTCLCPWPAASCNITFSPSSVSPSYPGSVGLTANVNLTAYNNEGISRVIFSSDNVTIATVNPSQDNSSPYFTTITTQSNGVGSVTATAFVGSTPTCQASIPVTVQSSCTVDLVPNSSTITVGNNQAMIANVTVNSSTVTSVAFSAANPAIASVSPLSDPTSPYSTTLTANTVGSTTLNAVVSMADGSTCTDPSPSIVSATAPGPWWQAAGGNVTAAGGSLSSSVPSVYSGLYPYLIRNVGGNTGVAVYGSAPSTANFGSGTVSSKNWISSTSVAAPNYDYNLVSGLIPPGWTVDTDKTNVNNLNSGSPAPDGYKYHKYTGPVTISNNQNINQQTVLIVNGDLNINNNLTLSGGDSFLMVVVSGSINVDPSVTQLDGLYLSNGSFSSGSGDTQLTVAGAVVAYGGFNLQRDLQGGNTSNPGELFTYDPRLILYFPATLQKDFVIWREVAP